MIKRSKWSVPRVIANRHTSDCSCVRHNKKQNTSHEFINSKQNFAKLVTKFESVRNTLSSALFLTQLNKICVTVSRLIFGQKPIRTRTAQCLTSRYSSPLSSSLHPSSPLSPLHFLVTLNLLSDNDQLDTHLLYLI